MEHKPNWIKAVYLRKSAGKGHDRPRAVASPYDVPEAFRFSNASEDRVLLEFRYLDHSESAQTLQLSGDVKVTVGRSTKRILSLEFKPSDHDVEDLVARLHHIIHQLSERGDLRQQAEWNYKAARDAVDGSISSLRDTFSGCFSHATAH